MEINFFKRLPVYGDIMNYANGEKIIFGQSVFKRFVLRCEQDIFLSLLHLKLARIYEKAVPLKWLIRESCMELIYTEEAQKAIDFYKEEIEKRHLELVNLFIPDK